MHDNAYLRTAQASMQSSSSSPSLSAVVVDQHPMRRRSNSKSSLWKTLRKYRHSINLTTLSRMRLRWRTVAKVLGGILFFKITLSILGSLVGTEPADQFMGMPDAVPRVSGVIGGDGSNQTLALALPVVTEPPPPPPIPQPAQAIKCENLRDYQHMVANTPEVDVWQTIQLGISFGYSAYFDDRLDGVVKVKVMAMADEWLDAKPPLCQLWFADRVEPFALAVNITNFPAQPTVRYKAVMYTCQYVPSQPDMPPPVAVSLSSEACAQPISMFKVRQFDRSIPPENRPKFSVCLASAMRLNFTEAGEMVDWIEVHKLFGVSHYHMYVNDIARNVNPFMDYYTEQGEMDVLQWKLPADIRDPRDSIKAFGQLTMINDCLYRNMFKSKYMVYLDLDEMMVPRGTSKTLEEALVTTSCQDKAQTIIRSAFFRKQWTNDEKFASDEKIVKRGVVSLLKTKRERKVLAINVHAKYIVIPEMIESLETLAALKFLDTVGNNTGEATCVLLAKECLLHHYRYIEEFEGDWMIDRKMHEFTKAINERTAAVWTAVESRIAAAAAANAELEAAAAQEVGGDAPVADDANPAAVQASDGVAPADNALPAGPAGGSVVEGVADADGAALADPAVAAPPPGDNPDAPVDAPLDVPPPGDMAAAPVELPFADMAGAAPMDAPAVAEGVVDGAVPIDMAVPAEIPPPAQEGFPPV